MWSARTRKAARDDTDIRPARAAGEFRQSTGGMVHQKKTLIRALSVENPYQSLLAETLKEKVSYYRSLSQKVSSLIT